MHRIVMLCLFVCGVWGAEVNVDESQNLASSGESFENVDLGDKSNESSGESSANIDAFADNGANLIENNNANLNVDSSANLNANLAKNPSANPNDNANLNANQTANVPANPAPNRSTNPKINPNPPRFTPRLSQDEIQAHNLFILEPFNQSAEQRQLGRYYTSEAYRAAKFGSMRIARDLFYKACSLGDNLGCLSLNNLNAPLNVDNLVAKKHECDLGVGDSCFWLFRYYASGTTLDSFKTDWFLDKSCRLGEVKACELKMTRFKPYITDNYQLLGNKCHKNDAQSCYLLGVAHFIGRFEGKKVAQNRAYALQLIQKSCILGFKKGCSEYHKFRR